MLSFLQKKNPNIPNIAEKLFPPQTRNLAQARGFWDLVFTEYPTLTCLYSKTPISKNDYTIDHFIPWRFVTHDLLWNLIPTPRFVNSAKSDSLPSLEIYFDNFASIQQKAFKIIFQKGKLRLLEDYSNLYYCELKDIYEMSGKEFKDRLYTTIAPLKQIAENTGFESNWVFQK